MAESETLLTVRVNDHATPVAPHELRAGQFFRLKNFKGEWSATLHLAVDVRVEVGEPTIRRYYNFTTGECYGGVPAHWKCYPLTAEAANGVGGVALVQTFAGRG